MGYTALLTPVVHGKNRKSEPPPKAFLDELIAWGKTAPDEIFEPRGHDCVYFTHSGALGPFENNAHRRAAMLEIMRVLAGHESSWVWTTGVDRHPQKEVKDRKTSEAGAWQVSANSMHQATELKNLVIARVGSADELKFQHAMKTNHRLAMEYIARLLRNTVRANGPVLHRRIDCNLRRDAVKEFLYNLYPVGSDMTLVKGHFIVPFFPMGGKGP